MPKLIQLQNIQLRPGMYTHYIAQILLQQTAPTAHETSALISHTSEYTYLLSYINVLWYSFVLCSLLFTNSQNYHYICTHC